MTQLMMQGLSPILIVAFGTFLSLLLIAWHRTQKMILFFTVAIFLCALLASVSLIVNVSEPIQVTALMKIDFNGNFAFILILAASIVVALLSSSWLTHSIEVHDELFLLLQLVVLGAGVLVMSDHFASLFLGFELLSIALVGMVGYSRDSQYSVEVSFKYLVLSACASSFMLLGIAFIYSQTGSLSFVIEMKPVYNLFYSSGIFLFLVGVAFKLSLAPFHFWTPDVYHGAPTSVTLLLATVSKVAMFVVLMKFWFSQPSLIAYDDGAINLSNSMTSLAVLSMIIGNILALKQQNIKRLLAYSSIAHMGYLLIVLMIISPQSIELAWQSTLFYLTAYILATLSLFIVLQITQGTCEDNEQCINDWQGMFWNNRLLALLVIVAILSLAGIPLTAGFIGKFYLLNVAVQSQQWWLIAALVIGSGIGLFYYLRIIFTLFNEINVERKEKLHYLIVGSKFTPLINTSVVALILVGVMLGIYPNLLNHVF